MKTALLYLLAALCEIGGCFAFWAWLRSGHSGWLLVPGLAALVGFAWLLTLVEVSHAGRAYAAYGGVYITASLVWLWLAEGTRPVVTDIVGAGVCLIGVAIIIGGARSGLASG
jgi:small multidrug resistance family-3 protein